MVGSEYKVRHNSRLANPQQPTAQSRAGQSGRSADKLKGPNVDGGRTDTLPTKTRFVGRTQGAPTVYSTCEDSPAPPASQYSTGTGVLSTPWGKSLESARLKLLLPVFPEA